MIAMVVAQVVDDRIEIFQPAQIRSLPAIVANFETRGQLAVQGMKAVHEKRDLCSAGQIGEQFFAIVADPGTLRTERAEVSKLHKRSRQSVVSSS